MKTSKSKTYRYLALICFAAALFVFASCTAKAPELSLENEPSAAETAASTIKPNVPLHTASDYDNRFGHPNAQIAETEEAYIWLPKGTKYFRFFDKPSEISGILCPRPECSHDSTDCTAYASVNIKSLCLMDGLLYWVGYYAEAGAPSSAHVFCSQPDLTDKKPLCSAATPDGYAAQRYFFHRGMLYAYCIYRGVDQTEPIMQLAVLCKELGSEDYSILYEQDFNGNTFPYCLFNFCGSKLYAYLSVTDNEFDTKRIVCIDLSTGETDELMHGCSLFQMAIGFWVTDGGDIYISPFFSADGNDSVLYRLVNDKLEKCMDFGAEIGPCLVYPIDGAAVGFGNGADGDRLLCVRSYDGETLYRGAVPLSFADEAWTADTISAYSVCGDAGCVIIEYQIAIQNMPELRYLVKYDIPQEPGGELIETVMAMAEIKK